MALSDSAIPLGAWRRRSTPGSGPTCWPSRSVNAEHLPHAVSSTCSASDEVAEQYPRWLAAGVHVVNAEQARQQRTSRCTGRAERGAPGGGSHFRTKPPSAQACRYPRRFETCARRATKIPASKDPVGHARRTCSTCGTGRSRSRRSCATPRRAATPSPIRATTSRAPTSPETGDPRTRDGYRLGCPASSSKADPRHVGACGVDEFMARLSELDAPMLARLQAATAKGASCGTSRRSTRRGQGDRRPRRARSRASVRQYQPHRQRRALRDDRYDRNPLVVQGPGAGPEVTAGGVFADLLRVCGTLAPSCRSARNGVLEKAEQGPGCAGPVPVHLWVGVAVGIYII